MIATWSASFVRNDEPSWARNYDMFARLAPIDRGQLETRTFPSYPSANPDRFSPYHDQPWPFEHVFQRRQCSEFAEHGPIDPPGRAGHPSIVTVAACIPTLYFMACEVGLGGSTVPAR